MSDNGGEYRNEMFQTFCLHFGITHKTSCAYTPQQNGVAERADKTILEETLSMLAHSGLQKELWPYAATYAVYIRNRLPSQTLNGKIPFEVRHSKSPSMGMIKTFGCRAFSKIPDARRRKLDWKAEPCRFLGIPATQNGFIVMTESGQIKVTRDVKGFDEGKTEQSQNENDNSDELIIAATPENHIQFEFDDERNCEIEDDETQYRDNQPHHDMDGKMIEIETHEDGDHLLETEIPTDEENLNSVEENEFEINLSYNVPTRSGRESRRPRFFHEEFSYMSYFEQNDHDIPSTYHDAFKSQFADEWQDAMEMEMASMKENNTWDLVEAPKNENVVGSRWVYALKTGSDGTITRFKARLVAQGYSQRYGVDYLETYAPVISMTGLRIFFAIAASRWMLIEQMDVTTAFLNSELDMDIYMRQPVGLEIKNTNGMNLVL